MIFLLLVVAVSGNWALDPEAVPDHPVTTIPVESNGALNVYFDPLDIVSVENKTNATDTTGTNVSAKLTDPSGPVTISSVNTIPDNSHHYSTSTTSSTLGLPATSEGYVYTTYPTTASHASTSTTSSTLGLPTTSEIYMYTNHPTTGSHPITYTASTHYTSTNGPYTTSPSNKPHVPAPTYSSISEINTGISNASGLSNSSDIQITSNENLVNGSGNASNTNRGYHMSDFYLPTSALGNYTPENISESSNVTISSSDSGSVGNSSMYDPANANGTTDYNSTNIVGHKRISGDPKPVNLSSDNIQSTTPGTNYPADVIEENGILFISNVYSHTNIPSVHNPINISHIYSPVNISDVFSPTNISNINSLVSISGIYSPVNIINVNSPVSISNVHSPLRISNVYSPITLYNVYSPVNITNVHSSINASSVYSPISIDDYSGKPNISETYSFTNLSNSLSPVNGSGLYGSNNISGDYNIDKIFDSLDISDILGIFGLDVSDFHGPANMSVKSNFSVINNTYSNTNLSDIDNLIYADYLDHFSTTESYLYSTTDLFEERYSTTDVSDRNIIHSNGSTEISKTNGTTKITNISGIANISTTISPGNASNTNGLTTIFSKFGTMSESDIDNLIYMNDTDFAKNASEKNASMTTETSIHSYYTTDYNPATFTFTYRPINVTEPYSSVNFTDKPGLVNASIDLGKDNITIDKRANVSDSLDSDNSTEEHGPTCSGGDILKHIFLSYRLTPPEVNVPRVYVVPVAVPVHVPVHIPVPVQTFSSFVPYDYNTYDHGRSSWDFLPFYYGASQLQGVYSPSDYYYPTPEAMPPVVSHMGHFDSLGYLGGQMDSYRYQDNAFSSPYDSSMYPNGNLDKRFSPIGSAEETAFEPSPYLLVDISEGPPPSVADQVPQGPTSHNTYYDYKPSMSFPSNYMTAGSSMPYSSGPRTYDSMTHRSDYSHQGSMSYSTDHNHHVSQSYQDQDSFFKGQNPETHKLFSDYVIPQDTKSYFEYIPGQDKVMDSVPQFPQGTENELWSPVTKVDRGEKWKVLELKTPSKEPFWWTKYLRATRSHRSSRIDQDLTGAELPMLAK